MTNYIAKAAAVTVRIGSAGSNTVAQTIREGDIVPAGVDDKVLESLVARGLIVAIADEKPAKEKPEVEKGPYDDVEYADLKAEVEKRNDGREDVAKIAPESQKAKDLVAALVADDQKLKAAADAAAQ